VGSLSDGGTGRLTVTFSVNFSNTNYMVASVCEAASGANFLGTVIESAGKATGNVTLQFKDAGDTATDPVSVSIIIWGDHA
jgi:hypothetical protein